MKILMKLGLCAMVASVAAAALGETARNGTEYRPCEEPETTDKWAHASAIAVPPRPSTDQFRESSRIFEKTFSTSYRLLFLYSQSFPG
jgi:hypothetical protein